MFIFLQSDCELSQSRNPFYTFERPLGLAKSRCSIRVGENGADVVVMRVIIIMAIFLKESYC